MLNRSWKVLGAIAMVSALVSVTGCNGGGKNGGNTNASNPAADDEAIEAPGGTESQHVKLQKGPTEFVFRAALEKLDLSAAQKTKIESALNSVPAIGSTKSAIFTDLATQIKAGKVDEASLASDVTAAKEDARKAVEKHFAALDTLHDTLTPDQRGKLVDALAAEHGHRGDGDKKHGHKDGDGKRGELKHGGRDGGGFRMMLHDLGLTSDQKDQLKSAFSKEEKDDEGRPEIDREKAFEAFRGADFKASSMMPVGDMPGEKLDKLVHAAALVTPILTADQRTKLAAKIAEGPQAFMGRPPFERGRGGPGNHRRIEGDD